MKLLRWFIGLNIAGLLIVAVWFRCRELGNLPGVNGDEAWYGVQAELVLRGEPITWRTPTGNALNPLFFGPQILLHAMFEPSFALLRTTAVASGLLAVVLNYILCRKVFGRRTALVSTVIVAVLPVNIVYSRLAWDACQSLLVTLPAVYWSLRAITVPAWRTWFSAAAMIALAASIVVHPTNLFVGPVVCICLLTAWREDLRFLWRHWKLPGTFVVLSVCLLAQCCSSRFAGCLSRLASPKQYGEFAIAVGRLFSGETAFEYVSRGIPTIEAGQRQVGLIAYDVAAALVAAWLAIGLVRWFSTARIAEDTPGRSSDEADHWRPCRLATKSLLCGWLLSLAAFFIVAGPAAIAPHFERYGICLIGPGVILAALGVCGWLECRPAVSEICALITVLLGWVLLLTARTELFDDIHATGGDSHETFRTAAIEPKQQAIDYIISQSAGQTLIRTSEWWLYWPVLYLSFADVEEGQIIAELAPNGAHDSPAVAPRAHAKWQIEFAGSPACESLRRLIREGKLESEHLVEDFAGKPTIAVFRVPVSPQSSP